MTFLTIGFGGGGGGSGYNSTSSSASQGGSAGRYNSIPADATFGGGGGGQGVGNYTPLGGGPANYGGRGGNGLVIIGIPAAGGMVTTSTYTIGLSGDLIPNIGNKFNLGSSSVRYKGVYAATIYTTNRAVEG
jgi:hypothetical protein